MSIDSEAVFDKRARELGMLEVELDRIKAKSWNTLGKFAFSCGYAPGGIDDVQLRRLASIVTGSGAGDPPDDRLPIVSRLYFESYTMVSSDLRSRVERLDDVAPRRLPNPERAVRHKQQASRSSGIELTGEAPAADTVPFPAGRGLRFTPGPPGANFPAVFPTVPLIGMPTDAAAIFAPSSAAAVAAADEILSRQALAAGSVA